MPEWGREKSACVAYGLGCPRARVDTARLYEYLRINGWHMCDSIRDAALVVVTACGFCGRFEEMSLEFIHAADSSRRADSTLVITGCLAGISQERLASMFNAELILAREAARFDDLIGASVPLRDVADPLDIEPYIDRASACFTERERAYRAHETSLRSALQQVASACGLSPGPSDAGRGDGSAEAGSMCTIRVAHGCASECSYCAIRFAEGELRSKPLDRVLAEFDAGLGQGFTEFRLVATDLGGYGQDIGTDVVNLLEGMMARTGDFHLTLQDFNLRWFVRYRDRLIGLLAENSPRIRSLLLPLQSGSERILSLMRRGHTAKDARSALLALRAACPQMELTTHVLIGFPTETARDFQDTLDLLRAVHFDTVMGYAYEDRPKTDASRMSPKVPWTTIKARDFRLVRETEGVRSALRNSVNEWGVRFDRAARSAGPGTAT